MKSNQIMLRKFRLNEGKWVIIIIMIALFSCKSDEPAPDPTAQGVAYELLAGQ